MIAFNPAVSCGASGLVFGVWGAVAVFGVRYRRYLPDRYRRYFLGSVVPYSVFALYFGLAVPGVDNWAHAGGFLGGYLVSAFLNPMTRERGDHMIVAFVCLFATLLSIVWSIVTGAALFMR